MKNPVPILDRIGLRLYVAGVVVTWLEFVCHLTNHVGACWFSGNGPAHRLYWWAWNVCNPDDGLDPSACNAFVGGSSHRCTLPRDHDGLHIHNGEGFSYVSLGGVPS